MTSISLCSAFQIWDEKFADRQMPLLELEGKSREGRGLLTASRSTGLRRGYLATEVAFSRAFSDPTAH